MRRHFDSKHPEISLKLPKESNRHACSCGRTFLEPNRLQEHMEVHFFTWNKVLYCNFSLLIIKQWLGRKIRRKKALKMKMTTMWQTGSFMYKIDQLNPIMLTAFTNKRPLHILNPSYATGVSSVRKMVVFVEPLSKKWIRIFLLCTWLPRAYLDRNANNGSKTENSILRANCPSLSLITKVYCLCQSSNQYLALLSDHFSVQITHNNFQTNLGFLIKPPNYPEHKDKNDVPKAENGPFWPKSSKFLEHFCVKTF